MGRAEINFREAFDRLKNGTPKVLPRGSKVTQNNVAREAGVDPSALRRSRFPTLVEEIQLWGMTNDKQLETPSARQSWLAERARNRTTKEQLSAARAQRDDALAKLLDAEAQIVSLTSEIEQLRALQPESNVAPLRPSRLTKPNT